MCLLQYKNKEWYKPTPQIIFRTIFVQLLVFVPLFIAFNYMIREKKIYPCPTPDCKYETEEHFQIRSNKTNYLTRYGYYESIIFKGKQQIEYSSGINLLSDLEIFAQCKSVNLLAVTPVSDQIDVKSPAFLFAYLTNSTRNTDEPLFAHSESDCIEIPAVFKVEAYESSSYQSQTGESSDSVPPTEPAYLGNLDNQMDPFMPTIPDLLPRDSIKISAYPSQYLYSTQKNNMTLLYDATVKIFSEGNFTYPNHRLILQVAENISVPVQLSIDVSDHNVSIKEGPFLESDPQPELLTNNHRAHKQLYEDRETTATSSELSVTRAQLDPYLHSQDYIATLKVQCLDTKQDCSLTFFAVHTTHPESEGEGAVLYNVLGAYAFIAISIVILGFLVCCPQFFCGCCCYFCIDPKERQRRANLTAKKNATENGPQKSYYPMPQSASVSQEPTPHMHFATQPTTYQQTPQTIFVATPQMIPAVFPASVPVAQDVSALPSPFPSKEDTPPAAPVSVVMQPTQPQPQSQGQPQQHFTIFT